MALVLTAGRGRAATRYVWQNSPSPTPPYTNWTSAAHVIQDAVDAALAGDEIVVTNGLYATGGRAVGTNLLVNRVAVDKPLSVRSVNGPQITVIQGYQVPVTTNGDGAIRCVFLANGASLSGFTLTNGATRTAGDWQELEGGGVFCESSSALVSNCVLVANSADYHGGGVSGGRLNNCTLTGNSASDGGGAADGYDVSCTLNNCTLTGNSALRGGGAAGCTLNNCLLTGNSARFGGGAFNGTLNNSTVTSNSASRFGGGAAGAFVGVRLNNCVVYFNTAPESPNFDNAGCVLNYCCTKPMPTNGVGNITIEPAFVDAAAGNCRLRPGSACIDAGTNLSAILTNDLDGRPRPVDGNGDGLASFDIGAYEYRALLVWQGSPSPTPPYATWATAATNIQDAVDAALAGDEIVVTNGIYAIGGRAVYGTMTNRVAVDKPLTVRSVNGPEFTIIQGYQVTGTTNGDGAIRCVYLNNGVSLSGFTLTNGATRTTGDFEREQTGGGLWCESTNAVASNCVVAGNSAFYGGGASGGTLNNCTLTANSAERGGGAFWGTLNNCTLTGNSALDWGGGASGSTLNNCTITGNSAYHGGGGVFVGALNNCIVYFNTAPTQENYDEGGTLYRVAMNYCCTTPLPQDWQGIGNITNAPLFVNQAGGNLRLQSNSPCINAGLNTYASGLTDLDGHPRIVSGTVDIGAYEFQGPGSVISYAWLQHYGLPTDGSADFADPDADGHTAWQEWRCQTDPTNALSVLRLLSATRAGTNVTVTWASVAGVNYFLERSTNLSATPPFTLLAPNLLGQPGMTSFTDTNAAAFTPLFYRVGVGN